MIQLRIYLLCVFVTVSLSAFSVLLNYPRLAVVPVVLSFIFALAYGDKATKLIAKNPEFRNPNDWGHWLSLPRPRQLRLRDNSRIANNSLLVLIGVTWVNQVIGAFWIKEVRSSDLRPYVVFSGLCIVCLSIGLTYLLLLWRKARRLMVDGEMSIGRVTGLRTSGRGRRTITYEFSNNAGELISSSGPDALGSIEVGSPIPIFYNPQEPRRDQIALSRSPYTLLDQPYVGTS
jgi:hypothetical protein